MSATRIILVELTGYTAAATSSVYRYATRGYVTAAADTPASTYYEPRVVDPGAITMTLFDAGSGAARANPSADVDYGFIRLANIDGELDDVFTDASFRERQVRVLSVQEGAAYSTATLLLRASISQVSLDIDSVVVGIKGRLYELASPHQTTRYGGTNSLPAGLDGVDDLAGKVKPLLYGKCFGMEPPCVNTSRLIFQVSARALESVEYVYDGGVALTAGTAYTDQTDMETNAPSAGYYRAWLAGGMIRLGSSLVYRLTVDATGDSAANSTAAQLLETFALARGIDAGDISSADVTALDADNTDVLGVWVNDDAPSTDYMDLIARSVGAYYRFDRLGVLRMARLEAPASADIVASVASWNCASVEQAQTGEDVPTSTVRLNYAKYHTVQQSSDLAASVSDADRADLGQEWRVSEYSASPSPNPYARLQEMTRDTALTTKSDADTEATRVHGIVGTARRVHILRDVFFEDDDLALIDAGSTIGLRWPRYGFDEFLTESPRIVLGLTTWFADMRSELTVWG